MQKSARYYYPRRLTISLCLVAGTKRKKESVNSALTMVVAERIASLCFGEELVTGKGGTMSSRRRRQGVLNWLFGAWILVLLTHCTFASITEPSSSRFVMNALLAAPNSEDAVAIEGRGGFANGFTFSSIEYVSTLPTEKNGVTVVQPTVGNRKRKVQSALDMIRDHLRVVDTYIYTLVEKALKSMEQDAMKRAEFQNDAQLFYYKMETFYILVAVKRVVIKPTGLLVAAKRLVVGLKNQQWMSKTKGMIAAKVPARKVGDVKTKENEKKLTKSKEEVQEVQEAEDETGKKVGQVKVVPNSKESSGCAKLLNLMHSGVEAVWRKQLGYGITGECTIAYAVVLSQEVENAKFVQVNMYKEVYSEFKLSDAKELEMI